MAKRTQIPADSQLLEEVSGLLETDERPPLPTRLEYWRQWEYIPSQRDGWGRGSTLSYPPGTAQQVVALMRELKAKRSIDRAALALFFAPEPYWIGAKALRRAVAAELERVRVGLEKLAHPRRGSRAAAAGPEQTASRLVEGLLTGRVSAEIETQRGLMLERLRDPVLWTEEESAEERYRVAFGSLLYVFLTGQSEPSMNDVFYETFVAYGGEEVVASLLPAGVTVKQFHALWGAFSSDVRPSPLAIVPDDVAAQMLSLPYLTHTLNAMSTADFERARSEGPLLVDLCTYLMSAIAALLPRDVLDRLASLDRIDWRLAIEVGGMPLLFELRRRNAEALDANLAMARENLSAWRETLESARQRGAFADEEKRRAIIADTLNRTKETLREGD
jgi:hypothetical protein